MTPDAPVDPALRYVIVLANCQGWVYQTALRGAPDFKGTHKVLMYQNFEALPGDYAEKAAATDVYIYQHEVAEYVKKADNLIREQLPASARIVKVPSAGFAPLWPNFMRDTKAAPDPRYPTLKRGPLPWKERFLEGLLKQSLPHDEIIARWFALDMPEVTKIDRMLELWTIKQKQLETECDVAFSDIALGLMPERQLFFWPEHPATFLLVSIADRILAHLGLRPLPAELYKHKDYLKDYELPIHPAIARHLGIQWAGEDKIYLAQWGEKVDLRGYLEFYLSYAAELAARKAAAGEAAPAAAIVGAAVAPGTSA